MQKHIWTFFAVILPLLLACEKPVIQDSKSETGEAVSLRLSVGGFNVIPFDETRSSTDIARYCSKLNFVVYQDGKKVKGINQASSDDQFGQVAFSLEPGSYQVLVLAHSANGNPVLSDPAKIQFTNDDGFTDTFFSYDDITIGPNSTDKEVVLDRCTAMFRLITTDSVPDEVALIRFYYTGGSGALDATEGFGCVNSKQVTFFDVTDEMRGKPLRLEIYTIPKATHSTLKILVQAYSAASDILYERQLSDVPIEMNRVTEYVGRLFVPADEQGEGEDEGKGNAGEGNGAKDGTPSFSVIGLNTEWGETMTGTY